MNHLILKNNVFGEELSELIEMINLTPSCVKVISQDGTLLNMNKSGLALIEADNLEQVVGEDIYELVEASHREKFIQFNQKICSGKKASLVFEIIGLKGTRRWMESYGTPYELKNGEVAHLAITNDVDEKIKAREELYRKEQALVEAERLSALGQFAGGVAHEINNPLAIIQSQARILIDRLEKNNQVEKEYLKEGLNNISHTVERISNIISTLRKFSRNSSREEKNQWYNLRSIVDTTLSLCKAKLRLANIDVQISIAADIEVFCQDVQLSHVLMNLINNAYDAVDKLDKKWIKIEAIVLKKKTKLLITDSGKGIDPVIAKKIMDPFFTTKDVGKGTGLGLSISVAIMESFKGKLTLNTQAKNTQFILELIRNER
jgi:PAS domain S-box-containing protein